MTVYCHTPSNSIISQLGNQARRLDLAYTWTGKSSIRDAWKLQPLGKTETRPSSSGAIDVQQCSKMAIETENPVYAPLERNSGEGIEIHFPPSPIPSLVGKPKYVGIMMGMVGCFARGNQATASKQAGIAIPTQSGEQAISSHHPYPCHWKCHRGRVQCFDGGQPCGVCVCACTYKWPRAVHTHTTHTPRDPETLLG
jgi:hypothetical protein